MKITPDFAGTVFETPELAVRFTPDYENIDRLWIRNLDGEYLLVYHQGAWVKEVFEAVNHGAAEDWNDRDKLRLPY